MKQEKGALESLTKQKKKKKSAGLRQWIPRYWFEPRASTRITALKTCVEVST